MGVGGGNARGPDYKSFFAFIVHKKKLLSCFS